MTELKTVAHAKLNLTLDVLGRRPDGYHDLCMVMQEITLGDEITLRLNTGKAWSVSCDSGEVPADDSNLAMKAARLFLRQAGIDCGGLHIDLQKHTPVCAGMGGGSADGAAVLQLLDDYYGHPVSREILFEIAEQVGSDVPFALFGGTALAREKGQVLTRLSPMPPCHIVLCKPPFPVSTPVLFRAIDSAQVDCRPQTDRMVQALEQGDLQKLAQLLCNVFEPVVERDHPEIGVIRQTMLDCGALGAAMTGSGPTVFGLFLDKREAQHAYDSLSAQYRDTFLTVPV